MATTHKRTVDPKMWMSNGLIKHTLPRPAALTQCSRVLEIGPGVRPMQWYEPDEYEAWEPYEPYVKKLRAAGYKTVNMAADGLRQLENDSWEQVIALDVIEHMDRRQGLDFLYHAMRIATDQVVIYTPMGFLEQNDDGWGLGGDYWQTHRSGWVPKDFETVGFQHIEKYAKSFFAIYSVQA